MRAVKTGWRLQQLYEGCLMASLAHAVMVAKYPDLSYEHSWDGFNYSVQDGLGSRGTISFAKDTCFGAFRVDHLIHEAMDIELVLGDLDLGVQRLAYDDTLQYLLDDDGGQIKPIVTMVFWSDSAGAILSSHDYSRMLEMGGQLLEKQVMERTQSTKSWQAYYDMNDDQIDFMLKLFDRKLQNPNAPIVLTSQELHLLGDDEEGLAESRTSFHELNILWDSSVV